MLREGVVGVRVGDRRSSTQQLGEEQRVWDWGGREETGRATGETPPLVPSGGC